MTDVSGMTQVPSTASTDSQAQGPSKSRRRLLLAAGAALPSICTLSSGAQAAVASNLRCLANEAAPPARFTPAPDNWVRAPVDVGDYDGTPAYCVTSPQSACSDSPQNWRGLSSPLDPVDVAAKDAQPGSTWIIEGHRVTPSPGVHITVKPGRKQYGLVYVDQQGSVSTLDPNGALTLTPSTNSCWASAMPGRTSKLG